MTQANHLDRTQPNNASTDAVVDGVAVVSSEHEHLALPVGTQIAEFVITGLIGIGGFGIVYLARDESLGRQVALKEYMPSSLAVRQQGITVSARSERNADTFLAGLKSFINEARMLALFNHPALVKVYRFWEANGTAYMVMPYYQGQTLKKALAGMLTPPSEAWLRQMLYPLLEALEIIHAKNCFHRDIAPDNILLLDNGQPLLLDFGAARQVISDMVNNLTVILKAGYTPIEQYTSDPNLPQGAWTDIYALGAVVHFAITGQAPTASVSRIVNDGYEPLTQRCNGLYTAAFLQVIDSSLAVKPGDRPQSVNALRTLLIPPANSATLSATPNQIATPPMGGSATPPHRPSWPWVMLVLVLLVAAGAYFMTQPSLRPVAAHPALPGVATAPAHSAQPTAQIANNALHPTVAAAATATPQQVTEPPPTTPDAAILTEMRETTATPPAAVTTAPSTPVTTPPPVKKVNLSGPPWLREMRQKLASCESLGLIEQLVCIDQTRKKYCAPSHWGTVDECRISRGLSND